MTLPRLVSTQPPPHHSNKRILDIDNIVSLWALASNLAPTQPIGCVRNLWPPADLASRACLQKAVQCSPIDIEHSYQRINIGFWITLASFQLHVDVAALLLKCAVRRIGCHWETIFIHNKLSVVPACMLPSPSCAPHPSLLRVWHVLGLAALSYIIDALRKSIQGRSSAASMTVL
ncbi:hypothetical protein PAAG_12493 [Paracoccidioides lutzii Pb01]|uniref:Uncharacterized protein n=1 Tax=Paracoccidioides lutzii (strain ATCC MYA-826 / Pb01) TaxID=502779 RepID=A0A0A2V001_PARBA|nr:hypothetical protein PAAG_12493 [Paracoccidioides lutzii Pb01]KGQ00828.1 hypothetical protein PAAG_12493 [Paracoccidioides lutzii Pb01]